VTSADRKSAHSRELFDARARVAIDLGAESCRVSLLRWHDEQPSIELIHRIPNGPVHVEGALTWPLDAILAGLDEGLRKAAQAAPEGIASIAVDGWAVDYVRLKPNGEPIRAPFCYRDQRTIVTKEAADKIADAKWMFGHTGTQRLRINTVYQLLADHASGLDPLAPWVCLPEYVMYRLGGSRVAEYTNATHTGLVDIETGDWSRQLIDILNLSKDALPLIVPTGTVIGKLRGPLAALEAFHDTQLILPACHDTASAIAGIAGPLDSAAYICSGTWSLVGTLIGSPITTPEAMAAGFTNQGAAGGGFCFHTNVNGMWILKQCLESWRGDMPARLNEQLKQAGCSQIPDRAGNEPIFARVIFESLANRYASAITSLEHILDGRIDRIHILGGGSLNQPLTRLTAERTGRPVECGNVESSTVGNFAVQMAASEAPSQYLKSNAIRRWARVLSENSPVGQAV